MSPSIFALSFSSNPAISPSNNITTDDSFLCQFTPADGSIDANITWFKDGSSGTGNDQDSLVVDDSQFQSTVVNTLDTAKNQIWICQVTLNNISHSISSNSSPLTIVNALPIITVISNQTVYENTAFNLQMTANDPDLDSIIWISADQNAVNYGGDSLFTISTSGLINFVRYDELPVGNHSIIIIANDVGESGVSGLEVNFEFISVNDAPVFTNASLTADCMENELCDHEILALDEEGDSFNFTTLNTLINLSLDGALNFVPGILDVGVNLIVINVSDGINWSTATLNLTINSTNHDPYFTFNSSNVSFGVQNQSDNFTFYVNASDDDELNTLTFDIDSSCSLDNPWSILRLTNGSGSTNASAVINLNFTNNNDFVVCRNITISVSDGLSQVNRSFSLNITNSNDVPTIFEESYYAENVVSAQFTNHNMSNVTLAKGLPFSFRVNATDIDNLTYEGEILTYSLFGPDSLLYKINTTTGLITSISTIMNDSYIGNSSFLVLVTDDEGLVINASINISIINNSLPVIHSFNSSDCIEDIFCYKEFLADDEEGSNLTFTAYTHFIDPNNNSHFYDGSQTISLFNISFGGFDGLTTNYTLNIYPEDLHEGNYSINITFIDDFYDFSTKELNFSVIAIDDVPYLGDYYYSSFGDSINFPITAENLPFLKILHGIDGDLYYGSDNLTFNYSFIGSSLTVELEKTSSSTAELTFIPTESDAGDYSINLTVIDDDGNFTSELVNFTVYDSVDAPSITAIKPYLNASNETVNSFTTSLGSNNISTVYVDEGNHLSFDVQATDGDDLNMKVAWYINGSLEINNLLLSGNSFLTKNFSYDDSGIINITAEVTDKGITHYTWLVTVLDIDRAPLFINNLTDLTASESAAITGTQVFADFFRLGSPDNIVFLDPDDDLNDNLYVDNVENNTLNFHFNESSSCNTFATFEFDGEQLSISPIIVGNCTATFYATDSFNNSVSSNSVRIDILDLGQTSVTVSSGSSSTQTVTRTITVPIDNDVPTSVKFIFPGISSLYNDGTVVIPFTIKNDWDTEVSGLDLSFNSSIPELVGDLSISTIDSLVSGGYVEANLTYFNYRFEAPFEVNISVAISSLEYVDTATVFINALEKGSYSEEAIKTRVGFARDLLNDNSECQELTEILNGAEGNNLNHDESIELINSVINGCKYLINTNKAPTSEVPKSFIGKVGVYGENYVDYKLLFTIILSLSILAIGIGLFSKFNLKKI